MLYNLERSNNLFVKFGNFSFWWDSLPRIFENFVGCTSSAYVNNNAKILAGRKH